LCTTVVHNTAQNSSDYFPPNLQTIITALMLSVERAAIVKNSVVIAFQLTSRKKLEKTCRTSATTTTMAVTDKREK